MQTVYGRLRHILQTPAGHNRVITGNQETCEKTHIADIFPSGAIRQFRIGTCRIRGSMPSDDKLTDHTGQPNHKHTSDIDQNKCRTTVFTCHIGKTPNIPQAHSTSCRSEDDT